MRTLHTGERYQHENGSIIEIVAPIYQSLTKMPIGYRLKKIDGQKEFTYLRKEIANMITDKKLKRIYE